MLPALQARDLNVALDSEFVRELNEALAEPRPGLLLVGGITRDMSLAIAQHHLKQTGERLSGHQGRIVFFEGEIRTRDDVDKAAACVDAGAMVVASIHGYDTQSGLDRLSKLAGRSISFEARVLPLSGRFMAAFAARNPS